jgi:hypothetical protein
VRRDSSGESNTLTLGVTAALLLAVAPAIGQPVATAPAPQGQIRQAAMEFSHCVQARVIGLAANVAPET